MKSFKSFLVEKPVKEPDPWNLDDLINDYPDPEADDFADKTERELKRIEREKTRKKWESQKRQNKLLDKIDPRGPVKKGERFLQSIGDPTGADPKTGAGTYKRRSFTPNTDVERVSKTSSNTASVNISSTDSKIVTGMDDARKVYTEPTKRIGPERKGFQNREYRAASDEGVRKFLQKKNMKGYHRAGEKLTPERQKGLELTNKQMKDPKIVRDTKIKINQEYGGYSAKSAPSGSPSPEAVKSEIDKKLNVKNRQVKNPQITDPWKSSTSSTSSTSTSSSTTNTTNTTTNTSRSSSGFDSKQFRDNWRKMQSKYSSTRTPKYATSTGRIPTPQFKTTLPHQTPKPSWDTPAGDIQRKYLDKLNSQNKSNSRTSGFKQTKTNTNKIRWNKNIINAKNTKIPNPIKTPKTTSFKGFSGKAFGGNTLWSGITGYSQYKNLKSQGVSTPRAITQSSVQALSQAAGGTIGFGAEAIPVPGTGVVGAIWLGGQAYEKSGQLTNKVLGNWGLPKNHPQYKPSAQTQLNPDPNNKDKNKNKKNNNKGVVPIIPKNNKSLKGLNLNLGLNTKGSYKD